MPEKNKLEVIAAQKSFLREVVDKLLMYRGRIDTHIMNYVLMNWPISSEAGGGYLILKNQSNTKANGTS